MLKLFLWLRYLRKKKIVFLSIAAVALSVALLIVVDSLFTGFIDAMQEYYITEAGDIFLSSGESISNYGVLIEKLEELEEVEAAAAYHYGWGLLHLESGDVREIQILGIEPARDEKFSNWRESLLRQQGASGELGFEVPGYPNDVGGWVGVNILAEPDEKTDEYDREEVRKFIGKEVVITTYGRVKTESDETSSAEGEETQRKQKLRYLKLRISDIAFTQTFFGDRAVYLSFEELNKLQFGDGVADATHSIKIKLTEGVDAEWARVPIFRVFEEFAAEQLGWSNEIIWQTKIQIVRQANADYFAELHMQMSVLLLIFGVICSVVILLIFCIFYMIVMTKQKDIAIIKSCGATSGSAALIFTGFGACVGVVGSALGILIGYVVTRNINTLEDWVSIVFGLKLWRSSSYMLNMIPNEVDWPAVWPIVFWAIGGCVAGALIPAIVAARTKPVEILRYE